MRLGAVAISAMLLIAHLSRPALADGCQDYNFLTGLAVGCQVTEESTDESATQSGEPEPVRVASGREVPPELVGRVVSVGADAGGGPCFATEFTAFDDVQAAENSNRQAAIWIENLGYGACPAVPGAPAVVLPSPETVALAFWRQADLPAPAPYVAPGYAVTGMRAYLESRAQAEAAFVYETVLGPLTIDARSGGLWVDWGDGAGWEGPHQSLGGPWPDGDISHLYGDKGEVTITVTQEWTATWAVGGASGTLGGMSTTGAIEQFHIGEIEAVLGDGDD